MFFVFTACEVKWNMDIEFNEDYSGSYKIDVERLGYDTFTIEAGNPVVDQYELDAAPITEISTESIPVFTVGNQVFVTIKAENPFPSSITSYSWKGHYNNRGISNI